MPGAGATRVADGLPNTRILPVPGVVHCSRHRFGRTAWRQDAAATAYDAAPSRWIVVDRHSSAAIRDGRSMRAAPRTTSRGAGLCARRRPSGRCAAPRRSTRALCEGEGGGSPHLAAWAADHAGLLQCDASIGLDGGVRTSFSAGNPPGHQGDPGGGTCVKSHGIDFWSGAPNSYRQRRRRGAGAPPGHDLFAGGAHPRRRLVRRPLPPDADDPLAAQRANTSTAPNWRQWGVRGDFAMTTTSVAQGDPPRRAVQHCRLAAGYGGEGMNHRAERGRPTDFAARPTWSRPCRSRSCSLSPPARYDDVEILTHTCAAPLQDAGGRSHQPGGHRRGGHDLGAAAGDGRQHAGT